MKNLIAQFALENEVLDPQPIKIGFINDSFILPAAIKGQKSYFLQRIDHVNWPKEFAACPDTQVHIATSTDKLYIRYDVTGQQLRAVAYQDQMAVWCDSCVEFFCQLPNSKSYMNFETNCIGTMVTDDASRVQATNDIGQFL